MRQAMTDNERGLGELGLTADDDVLKLIATYSSGDARTALNSLELAALIARRKNKNQITDAEVKSSVQQAILKYDKDGEHHYNLISALHKSMRNSDVDASLYWLARMLEAGEEPLYVARRLVRFASEDIGMASPEALVQCMAATHAVELIGMPEGKLALAQATVFMALAPKSNAVYTAYGEAARDALNMVQHPVPMHLRNAPTKLMKELGYSDGYQYAHNYEGGRAEEMKCLPDELLDREYYKPTVRGMEGKIKEAMDKRKAKN